MVAYAVIQILDGNVLAPLLLSGVVNLHPVAIVVAVLLFGGLWAFGGCFSPFIGYLANAVIKACLPDWNIALMILFSCFPDFPS